MAVTEVDAEAGGLLLIDDEADAVAGDSQRDGIGTELEEYGRPSFIGRSPGPLRGHGPHPPLATTKAQVCDLGLHCEVFTFGAELPERALIGGLPTP